jgi:hypothetical protein
MNEIERRYLTCELRAEGDEIRRIVGYGAVFNVASDEIYGFRELIMPGAFREVIEVDDVRALINHDPNLVLGRRVAGTLRLFEDETGLRYEIDPPDTQPARDVIVSLDRGDVNQSSFSFRVRVEDEEWRGPTDDEPLPLRIIHKFSRLFDVGPVTFPAYPATSVSARALDIVKQMTVSGRATGTDEARAIAVGRRDLLRRKLNLTKLR